MLNLEIVGQGATTKIYRDGNTAIKLYVNAPLDEAENEAKNQRFAYDIGLPVPAIFGVRRIDDNKTALDMEYITGKPFMQPKMDKDERRDAIHTLVKLQCLVHSKSGKGLPNQTDRLAWKIERTKHLDCETKTELLLLLNRLSNGSSNLCHGDFHPLNILYDGNKYWIIDWVDATMGNPLSDACRTYLIFKQHMNRSSGIYLKAFCKECGIKQDNILVWLPIVAAARLDENMNDDERTWMMSQIKTYIE